MSTDMSQYLGAFLDEASDSLQQLNELILSIEKDRQNMETINEIFRTAHTVKGMSATMGYNKMAELTHALEDRFSKARNGELLLSENDIDLLFESLDTMQAMVTSIRDGGSDIDADSDALISKLRSEEKLVPEESEANEKGDVAISEQEKIWMIEARKMGMSVLKVDVTLDTECMLKAARSYMVVNRLEEAGELIKVIPNVEDLEKEAFDSSFVIYLSTRENSDSVHEMVSNISEISGVEVSEVNLEEDPPQEAVKEKVKSEADCSRKLVNNVDNKKGKDKKTSSSASKKSPAKKTSHKSSQTVRVDIGRLDSLMNLVGELVIGKARFERLVLESKLKEFDEPLSQMGRISGDIQELVTKLRMVPVSFIFDKFPRLIRDLSKTLGKEIDLKIEGQETELDRTVIDEIGDPMVHLIRNSIDHGIESPEEREANGKPGRGTIRIAAYQEGNSVIIEVSDDGKGIDPVAVGNKAVERGMLTREALAEMPEEKIIKFIFLPGFSMASEVTDISGRGVGMDAVKSKVESLGGQFDVRSKVGEGTSVLVRLPLTLAIVLALLVKVGDETYALPLENVDETILVRDGDMKMMHGRPVTLLRGEVLSLTDLAGILKTPGEKLERKEHPVVVARVGNNRVGFIVDALVGQQEIVIKSLGKLLSKIRGVAGATILGDGNVALILDVGSLWAR